MSVDRSRSMIATPIVGAIGSVILLLVAGRNSPQTLLIALFVLWVGFPFFVMVLAARRSSQWPERRQRALNSLMLVVTGLCLIAFAYATFGPPKARPTPFFVIVPPLALIVTLAVIAIIRKSQSNST